MDMRPYDMISAAEEKMMHNYITTYAGYGDICANPSPMAARLSAWNNNKQALFDLMGGNLILEREANIETDSAELIGKLYDRFTLSDTPYKNAWNNFTSEIINILNTMRNSDDIRQQNFAIEYPMFFWRFTTIGTYANPYWDSRAYEIPLPDGKTFKVTSSTKLSRIIFHLSKYYSIPSWDIVRNEIAKVMTSRFTRGTLCLSIHPMDFMTMADNDNGWDSCMSWNEDNHGNYGEYRSGTIEMMNSPYILMAYIKSDEDTYFNGQWNDKKWRELYIVHDDIISNIRAYPYCSSTISAQVIKWIRSLFPETADYTSKILVWNINKTGPKTSSFFTKKDILIRISTDHMYNDYGREPQYVYLRDSLEAHTVISLNISGPLTCMWCGEEFETEDSSSICCESCFNTAAYLCDFCGERFYDEEYMLYVDGQNICQSCFDDACAWAIDDEHEPHLIDRCYTVYLGEKSHKNKYGGFSHPFVYFYDIHNFTNYFPNDKLLMTDEEVYYVDIKLASKDFRAACDQ